ncbi:helix-turn-helix domain-containing protein [Sphaerisporangium aureirubrum]|uniref:Helix-turn-helix domain-containing protein n=1 Tax=Sphaerisporangium aureirubrum TaxID=1544736 RepID=A0ABW1N8Y2_9ACTN
MSDELSGPAAAFAQRVERERVNKGLSKTLLVERAGIGRVTLDRLGTRTREPRPSTVIGLADALDIDHDEAFELAGLATHAEHQREASDPSSLAEVLARRMPDVDEEILARVVLNLADIVREVAEELFDRAKKGREDA